MAEVVTGEAVVLDVPCASFPSRIAALLIDMIIQIVLLVAVLIAVAAAGHLDNATEAGISLTSYVLIVVGYATIFETLTRGKTPGKMALGLRVVSDDGSPVRFRQALVRALTGAVEIWSWLGAPIGLITSIISVRGKRLGDMFAGTYVIQERAPKRAALPPTLAAVPPPLLGWAQVAETSRLSDQTAEAAGSYLRRLHELAPAARDELGLRLANAVAAQVSPPPPPGTPPAAYLAAVLAVRRQRDQAWLASLRAATTPAGPVPPQSIPAQPAPGQPIPAQPPQAQPAPGWLAPGQQAPAPAGADWPALGPPGATPSASHPPASPQPETETGPSQPPASPAPGTAGFAPPA